LLISSSVTTIGANAFYKIGCPNIYLKSVWTLSIFVTWWNSGNPASNLTIGGKTWTSGKVYVDNTQITW
jgi:hypothetical protein